MESKDGKDSLNFSHRNPAGTPAGQSRTWTPGSTSPWAWPSPPPWTTFQRRSKTPSQWRRDQKRREEFIAKKKSSIEVKEEVKEIHDNIGKTAQKDPEDEIELEQISSKDNDEAKVNALFKIEGEYKNPKFKPWTTVEPEKEFKTLWEQIKKDNEIKGIEEIGEGSATFEHCFEFWGTWRIKKPGLTIKSLENNVPKDVPGIAFLSGGQSDKSASNNLSCINKINTNPWKITFSYGRALQLEAMKKWRGDNKNNSEAQKIIGNRAYLNSLAASGKYNLEMENK